MKKEDKTTMDAGDTIILGSTSIIKKEALQKACALIGYEALVTMADIPSGQNEQPVGFEEIYAGALARAEAALKQNGGAVMGIGIENGIIRLAGKTPRTYDIAICVLALRDGRRISATSPGIEFPEEYVKLAEKKGFATTTVGSIIAEKLGGKSVDPHSTLTEGKVTRLDTLVVALLTAFRQV